MIGVELLLPAEGAIVSQLKDEHKAYMAMPREERVAYFGDFQCRDAMLDVGHQPRPVLFAWAFAGVKEGEFTLRVAPAADFSGALIITTAENSVEVENLLVGTQYYWQVSCRSGGQTIASGVATFFTEDRAPRILRVGGVKEGRQPIPYKGVLNMRDLGGYHTLYGRRVRQGMIYRSAGLNNNASPVYYELDDLADMPQFQDVYHNHMARQAALGRAIKSLRACLDNPAALNLIPSVLSNRWVAFRPDNTKYGAVEALLDTLDEIPETFLEAPAEIKEANDYGATFFAETSEGALAIFMQQFDAEADGYVQVGCGADWYWDLRVNGVKVFDQLRGNVHAPVAADNHIVQFPVRKGRNLVVAQVRSGSSSWTWCCAPAQPRDSVATLTAMLENLTAAAQEKPRLIKEYRLGASRLNATTLDYLRNHLGIKTDIDVRGENECFGMTGSPLGPDIPWMRLRAAAYIGVHLPRGQAFFRDFFRAILDRDIYPFVMHCIGGKDRTGSFVFLLHGLLGVSEEELYLEWEMSGFFEYFPGFDHNGCFFNLTRGFEAYPGTNINEKIEAYARNIGITAEEIATFRNIMLE